MHYDTHDIHQNKKTAEITLQVCNWFAWFYVLGEYIGSGVFVL